MSKSRRIPRKLKKKLKKLGAYQDGMSWWHCIVCQKGCADSGYNIYWCKKCVDK